MENSEIKDSITWAATYKFSCGFVNMCLSVDYPVVLCMETKSSLIAWAVFFFFSPQISKIPPTLLELSQISHCIYSTVWHSLLFCLNIILNLPFFSSFFFLLKQTGLVSYLKILAQTTILTFVSAFVLAWHSVILNYVHCDTICMNKQSAELVCNALWNGCRQHSLQWDMGEVRGHSMLNN